MRFSKHALILMVATTIAAAASSARAAIISIANVAVSTAGTTGDNNTSNARYVTTSAVTNAGGSTTATVGAVIDGAARFTMAAETRAPSGLLGTTSGNYDANYTVTFDVIADPGVEWDLEIGNSRLGVLLTGSGGGNGLADINASTATVNGNTVAALGLSDVAGLTAENGTTGFSDSKSTIVSGIGSASYTLNFSWHVDADSTQGFFAKGDKAGVLLGSDIAWSETDSQVNYQSGGNAGHFAATDGHFVTFQATVTGVPVPEPSTLAMAGIGLAVGGFVAGRRRWAA